MPGLPSSGRLLRSTAIALAVAAAILVAIVLPAEYGVDATGIGRVLGLKQMGEAKMALAKDEASQAADAAAPPSVTSATPPAAPALAPAGAAAVDSVRSDVIEVVLAPTQGKEIKLVMRKDAKATY